MFHLAIVLVRPCLHPRPWGASPFFRAGRRGYIRAIPMATQGEPQAEVWGVSPSALALTESRRIAAGRIRGRFA